MQSRNNDIKALREILKLAKSVFWDQKSDITNENVELYDDTLSAFSMIGKEKIYEVTDDVYQFLDCDDDVLRQTAVTTLGLSSRLHLPEFKDKAYKIWLEDKSDIVKGAALHAWVSYYANSKNSEAIKILFNILTNEDYPVQHRRDAMQYIFYVAGENPKFYDPFQDKHLYMLKSHAELDQKIDWDEIKAIIKKYAPAALS